MELVADLVQGEIPRRITRGDGESRLNPEFPHDGNCASRHAPAPPVETRFFHVVALPGSKPAEALQPGIYCEWCLVVSNRLERCKKEGIEPNFDPQEELDKLLGAAWERESRHYG